MVTATVLRFNCVFEVGGLVVTMLLANPRDCSPMCYDFDGRLRITQPAPPGVAYRFLFGFIHDLVQIVFDCKVLGAIMQYVISFNYGGVRLFPVQRSGATVVTYQ